MNHLHNCMDTATKQTLLNAFNDTFTLKEALIDNSVNKLESHTQKIIKKNR